MTIAAVVIALTVYLASDEAYHWPLDLPRVITSSFGEYRPDRFHVGLDLRTAGIGREVYAAAGGYVSRVRCSPRGYGKAVYVRLHDGNTAVYAHLDAFAEPLASYVRRAQHRKRSYTVDLYPKPQAFLVERGQVIAQSGGTGDGPPHLHYELRDHSGRPVNPQRLGVTWPDKDRPVIQRVLIVPADPSSTVNGDVLPFVARVQSTGEGEYTCGPVHISGGIGLGVDVVDPANGGNTKLGVYKVRMLHRDQELFRVQHDVLSYEAVRHGAVAYYPFSVDEGRYLLQWRWPGNEIESFRQTAGNGWYQAPPEPTLLRIEAVDFGGNMAALTVPLIPELERSHETPSFTEAESGTVRMDCLGDWLVFTAMFTGPEPEAPELRIDGVLPETGGVFRRVDETTFRICYVPGEGVERVTLCVVHDRLPPYEQDIGVYRRDGKTKPFAMGEIKAQVYPGSPYGTLFITKEPLEQLPLTADIAVLGGPYSIQPKDSPIDTPVELDFPMPEGAERHGRVHMYRASGKSWEFIPTKRKGDYLRIATRKLGVFAAMEDDQAPVFSNVVIRPGEGDMNRRPVIRAGLRDRGSGVRGVTVTCDKQWLLTAYDPDNNRIEWEQDEDLPPGDHVVTFQATDMAGNVAAIARRVSIPE